MSGVSELAVSVLELLLQLSIYYSNSIGASTMGRECMLNYLFELAGLQARFIRITDTFTEPSTTTS